MFKTLNVGRALRTSAACLVFGTAGLIFLAGDLPNPVSKNARQDPGVTERINQARGLQKVGKWKDAADILSSLAEEGHPIAMYHLGRAFKNGWGVEADFTHARHLFKNAARFGFAYRGEVAYEIGRLYQRSAGDDCNRIALEWFLKSLSWGYPKAHVQLAKHFERGLGVARDLDLSFEHYEKAAIAGYPSSTINYARILLRGKYGTKPAPDRALFWAERAMKGLAKKARDGSPSAAKSLGRIYRDGEFADRDVVQALEWFNRAAELGDPGGMHDLAMFMLAEDDRVRTGRSAVQAEPVDPSSTVEQALSWLKLAAKAKHGGAMTALGRLHLAERHGLRGEDSVAYFESGVVVGHPGAMAELARLHVHGRYVKQDRQRALDLAQKGADRGHIGSATLLKELTDPDQSAQSVGKRDQQKTSVYTSTQNGEG